MEQEFSLADLDRTEMDQLVQLQACEISYFIRAHEHGYGASDHSASGSTFPEVPLSVVPSAYIDAKKDRIINPRAARELAEKSLFWLRQIHKNKHMSSSISEDANVSRWIFTLPGAGSALITEYRRDISDDDPRDSINLGLRVTVSTVERPELAAILNNTQSDHFVENRGGARRESRRVEWLSRLASKMINVVFPSTLPGQNRGPYQRW